MNYAYLALCIMGFVSKSYGEPVDGSRVYKDRLLSMNIILDPDHELGFDDCCMENNGEASVIKNLIHGHDIVFDVGANEGEWSCDVLITAPQARIYAFEPLPYSYDLLCKRLNSSCCTVYQCALFNQKGEASLTYYPEKTVLSSLFERPIVIEKYQFKAEKVIVMTDTLDAFCQEHQVSDIDFLKIDTEGAEWNILQGAQNLIENHRIGIIQFEYGGTYLDASTTLHDVYCYLRKHSYALYRISGQGLIPVTVWDERLENYRYSNYLAVLDGD